MNWVCFGLLVGGYVAAMVYLYRRIRYLNKKDRQ